MSGFFGMVPTGLEKRRTSKELLQDLELLSTEKRRRTSKEMSELDVQLSEVEGNRDWKTLWLSKDSDVPTDPDTSQWKKDAWAEHKNYK